MSYKRRCFYVLYSVYTTILGLRPLAILEFLYLGLLCNSRIALLGNPRIVLYYYYNSYNIVNYIDIKFVICTIFLGLPSRNV